MPVNGYARRSYRARTLTAGQVGIDDPTVEPVHGGRTSSVPKAESRRRLLIDPKAMRPAGHLLSNFGAAPKASAMRAPAILIGDGPGQLDACTAADHPRSFGFAHDRPGAGFRTRSHDGAAVALDQFRGKVITMTFIFVSCSATCPILTAKFSTVQDRLKRLGSKSSFSRITVTRTRRPRGAEHYALTFGADPAGWKFLTGSTDTIREVEHRYGVLLRGRPAASWITPT